mgnify:CR=1 FL=1
MKTAFVCFFPVFPTNMGSAEVIRSLFVCWPNQKRIFQISHINKKTYKQSETIFINKENPFYKILMIPLLISRVLKYLKNSKKKLVIIEGPSWVGYSFLSLILIRIFSPSTKVIYHSHSIEYEVRKMMSGKIITQITKKLEHFVFKFSNLATSVSDIESEKIKKLYNVRCLRLNNGISKKIIKFNKKKIIKFNYIIYCGSYKYLPNKLAIDFIYEELMPKLIKLFPKLKLVLTGGGFKKKANYLHNFDIVSKRKLLNLMYNSLMVLAPINKGTGTRIKIIEALIVGANVITTKKGIEGLNFKENQNKFPIIVKKSLFFQKIVENYKLNKSRKKKVKFYDPYIMENIVSKFLKDPNVKIIFKKN